MKVLAISDTHGYDFTNLIDECDLLLIGGDISPARLDHSFYMQQSWFDTNWIAQMDKLSLTKCKHIVFIGGNHDTYLGEMNISKKNDMIQAKLPSNVHYLCDSVVEIEGVKIYGSPWCNLPSWARSGPPVWNFAKTNSELRDVYAKIPDDTDILLTHGPAFGFCDSILDEKIVERNTQLFGASESRLGSSALTERIVSGLKPKYVISGHIHSAQRNFAYYKRLLNEDTSKATKFACVSIMDEKYSPVLPPLEFTM